MFGWGSIAERKSREVRKQIRRAIKDRGVWVLSSWGLGYVPNQPACTYDKSFYFIVRTDENRNGLRTDNDLCKRFQEIFEESGYNAWTKSLWKDQARDPQFVNRPEYLEPEVIIESKETVRRDYKGSYYLLMK